MHILILASGYPTEYSPNQGIFFRDQAESLAGEKSNQVALIAVIPISIKTVWNKKKWTFGLSELLDNGVKTILYTFPNIPKLHRYRLLKSQNKGIKLIADYIEKSGIPDIIHVHGFQSGLLAIEAKKRYGIPYVITEHSSQFIDNLVPAGLEKYAKAVFSQADTAIAVSARFAELMSDRYQREFRYVPNVVDTAVFQPREFQDENHPFTFFNAAGFYIEKNHPMLLEAFAQVLKSYPLTRLRLAGSGTYEAQMKNYSRELGIDKQVSFLGLLPRNKIVEEMQRMDSFVLSSNVETFGVVLIEAMSCGKPVVSTACFGPESIVSSPEYGIICAINASDLASGMKQMIENYSDYNPVVIRKWAIDQFSNDAIMNQLMQIYQKVVSKSNV